MQKEKLIVKQKISLLFSVEWLDIHNGTIKMLAFFCVMVALANVYTNGILAYRKWHLVLGVLWVRFGQKKLILLVKT